MSRRVFSDIIRPMRYLDEFRDRTACTGLIEEIRRIQLPEPVSLMEVCGTHTMAVSRFGIRSLLPKGLRLVSGPGCPVCVTPMRFLDHAIALSHLPKTIIATFGDLIRVPGSRSSLERERASGAQVKVVYSTLKALELARREPQSQVIFLGVGFETTSPTVSAALLQAEEESLANFFVLSDHKVMLPAMLALLQMGEVGVQGFLCPGHVSVIIGSEAYRSLAEDHGVACVISGFEPLDILRSLLLLVRQVTEGRATVDNTYGRAVTREGSPAARRILERVFVPADAEWRGLGVIPGSGLRLRDELKHRDAARVFPVDVPPARENPACRCPEIIRGVSLPFACPLFDRACTPTNPQGACMVSTEGACAAYYRYERHS